MRKEYPMTAKRLILRNLAFAGRKMAKLERVSTGELTGSQVLLLPVIDSLQAPPTLGEVSQANGTSHQNTREILKKLECKGFVALKHDKFDYRILRVFLTEKGSKAVDEYYLKLQAPVKALFEGLDEQDVEAASRVLIVLCDRIDILHPDRL